VAILQRVEVDLIDLVDHPADQRARLHVVVSVGEDVLHKVYLASTISRGYCQRRSLLNAKRWMAPWASRRLDASSHLTVLGEDLGGGLCKKEGGWAEEKIGHA
jgi:hypothetical protein